MSEISPPCVILNEPQLAENIGSVARVMANFGLSELRLVRPRDGWPQERAWVSASGANWPLDNAKVYQRLEAAVADRQIVFATTARNRELRLAAGSYKGNWRDSVVFVCALLFTLVWWNVPHSRTNWLITFIALVILSVVVGVYAARGIIGVVRRMFSRP